MFVVDGVAEAPVLDNEMTPLASNAQPVYVVPQKVNVNALGLVGNAMVVDPLSEFTLVPDPPVQAVASATRVELVDPEIVVKVPDVRLKV